MQHEAVSRPSLVPLVQIGGEDNQQISRTIPYGKRWIHNVHMLERTWYVRCAANAIKKSCERQRTNLLGTR